MNENEKKTDNTEVTESSNERLNLDDAKPLVTHAYHKLSKPFEFCGQTYTELDMDFEGLTGRVMESIDDELGAMGITIAIPAISHRYQRMVAARAAHVPSDMIEQLPLGDYNKITGAARRFLLVTD